MYKFWITYSIILLSYIGFNWLYIKKNHTLGKKLKITLTLSCILILSTVLVLTVGWRGFIASTLYIGIWALFVDSGLGLLLHGKATYMSETTWPDKILLPIVQNGKSYLVYKLIFTIMSLGLLYYI